MGLALEEARKAAALGEVPVGAVVARNGEVVAAAHTPARPKKTHCIMQSCWPLMPPAKAGRLAAVGVRAVRHAGACPMCAGAIINSRIRRVVYGAADTKAGCCGSVTDLFAMPFNHHPVVEQGLRAEEAQELLQTFFKDLRARLAARPKWKPSV